MFSSVLTVFLNFCRSSAIWRCLLSPFDAEPSIIMSFYGRTATASLSGKAIQQSKIILKSE
ncbi:hypothetical protein KCP76_03580 [Salmonella enterica subsp. enterica serovar Weltevreden]|nr:hypothetical protein KCP76_03580 [Salmonella enterica subsp. enterica serovar Weltevreden]